MAGILDVLGDLAEEMDQRLPSGLYVAISVPTDRIRARLRALKKPFVDPEAASQPAIDEVDRTAWWVVRQSSYVAAGLGGAASVAGAVTVPPEAAMQAVSALRLAQRLAVVYGFDPETDSGQIATWRALAAGLEIELPAEGPLSVRVSDLPRALVPTVDPRSAGLQLTRAVLVQSAWLVARRLTRFVPIVSPGISAYAARRRTRDVGRRMQEALRKLADVPNGAPVEDAVEIP